MELADQSKKIEETDTICDPIPFGLTKRAHHTGSGTYLGTEFRKFLDYTSLPFVLSISKQTVSPFSSSMGNGISLGHIFMKHSPNSWWSLGVGQNAIDRLGGKTTKLVFVFCNGPGGGST